MSMDEDEGFQGVSAKKSCKIHKHNPIVPTIINNNYGVLDSVKIDNNNAASFSGAASNFIKNPVIKIPPIIVRDRIESAQLYVNKIRSVLRHSDFNISSNSKDSRIHVIL